ncbi:MAG: hypothetical protein ACERKD_22865 [Prolixibacteraceae bacterium]
MKNTLLISFLLLIASCNETEQSIHPQNINSIKYGTSFGECIGYCINSIEITEGQIELTKTGWEMSGTLPEINRSETMDNEHWLSLIESINFDAFQQLDSIIGCPDCADGGAEWIEIKKENQSVKIVFEYMNEPQVTSELTGLLRTYMAGINVDSSKSAGFNERTLIQQSGTVKNFLCSRGCYQYLIELNKNGSDSYYFDPNLNSRFQVDGLKIRFSGVL